MTTKRPPCCPGCGSRYTMPMVWGFPRLETFESYQRGEVQLGGCCVTDNDPKWYCKSCEHKWGVSEMSR